MAQCKKPECAHDQYELSSNILNYSNGYWGDSKCHEIVQHALSTTEPSFLDMRGNRFEAVGAKILATKLLRFPKKHHIVAISLEWNNVGILDEGVFAIAKALEIDTNLVKLDMRNNNITCDGAVALAQALVRNKSLRSLDLRWNDVGNAGAVAFKETLRDENHTLIELELVGNNSNVRHLSDIDVLLQRNRKSSMKKNCEATGIEEFASSSAKQLENEQSDELMLQILAEKDQLLEELQAVRKLVISKDEQIAALEDKVVFTNRKLECAEGEREDCKRQELRHKQELHESRLHFDEIDNRKTLAAERYQVTKSSLERELEALRTESLQKYAAQREEMDIKSAFCSSLQAENSKITTMMHVFQQKLSMRDAEANKLRNEVQVTKYELEDRMLSLVATHEENTSALKRMHENELSMVMSQLQGCRAELEDRRRSADTSRQKAEDLQSNIMHLRATYEKDIASVRVAIEAEVQVRMQRTIGTIDEKLQGAKQAREQLENELAKQIDNTARLLEQITQMERVSTQQRQTHREHIAQLESSLQKHQDQERTARQECQSFELKVQAQLRQLQHMGGVAKRMKVEFEEQLEEQRKICKTEIDTLSTEIGTKNSMIEQLGTKVTQIEKVLTRQVADFNERFASFIKSFRTFLNEQEAKRGVQQPAIKISHTSPTDDTHNIDTLKAHIEKTIE
uniref:Uncharacterized protein AlNc14C17G1817 n=1 Tax=Albugo laibachii Nc14 TaxID=890382 RepID=F0W4J7_9STRA|nr:conserved hypothetical protein [Albugo laibachii Nc14]|eukprot:CCA16030.1 conserved hypothetical protein [Albugo laibachii Nc14]